MTEWRRFSADPRTPEAASLRAGDGDRDLVLDVLRDAYADGRIDSAEYDRRVDRALAVVMVADVQPLLVDLLPDDRPVRRRSAREEAVEKFRREHRDARNGWIAVTGITVSIWAAVAVTTANLQYFWPIWPILGVGIGFLMHRVNAEQRIDTLEEEVAARRRRLEG